MSSPKTTRCACVEQHAPERGPANLSDHSWWGCTRDAVRIVETNHAPSNDMETLGEIHCDLTPMCEPCASHAEGRVAR